MRDKIVRPERRHVERRQDRLSALSEVVVKDPWEERRVHCWHIEKACDEERRKQCAAYFIRRNCWDIWALEFFPPGRKPCCHPELDCSDCAIATSKFGDSISVYVDVPTRPTQARSQQQGKDRGAVHCLNLYSLKDQAAARQIAERVVFRCKQRSGIQLHESYVTEVCSSAEHRDCPFYE